MTGPDGVRELSSYPSVMAGSSSGVPKGQGCQALLISIEDGGCGYGGCLYYQQDLERWTFWNLIKLVFCMMDRVACVPSKSVLTVHRHTRDSVGGSHQGGCRHMSFWRRGTGCWGQQINYEPKNGWVVWSKWLLVGVEGPDACFGDLPLAGIGLVPRSRSWV